MSFRAFPAATKMIDLAQWRASVGCFNASRGYHSNTACTGHNVQCPSILYCILVVLLVLLCADLDRYGLAMGKIMLVYLLFNLSV